MLVRLKIPKTIQWVFKIFIIYFFIFTFFRIITLLAFKPSDLLFIETVPCFALGILFDLRWISFLLLPIILFSFSIRLTPFYSVRNKIWWSWYLAFTTLFILFFFAADIGNFAYNKTRINASALNFVEDASISFSMLWQSYPLFWMILGLVITVLLIRLFFKRTHSIVIAKTDGLGIPYRRNWFVLTTALLTLFIYGNFGRAPLKWQNAFVFQDNFKSYLALNPFQNFFTTLKFREPLFNEDAARNDFSIMSDFLQLPNSAKFNYTRNVLPRSKSLESKPNVVLVMCESFSMYKSSLSGNPLNATAYFNELTKEGLFFENCFTPHFSTARGLFSLLTGIPDVQLSKFSTRNPLALNQKTIINSFEDYSKMYLIGGNPEFNNFEGLIKNINDVQIFREKNYASPKLNVWGISDKNLFLESNKIFKKQEKPFFAIIQTSNNHRPFMIPDEDINMPFANYSLDTLNKYGFESLQEYKSFVYSDYCFKVFIEQAKKESYFHNTIFVFVGDHGVSGNAEKMYPSIWTEQKLTDVHVPLLIYAPYLIQPEKRKEVVSQIDVLPTIAGLMHQSYTNSTLGRDVLSSNKKENAAFIIHHDEGNISLMTDSFYYSRNLNLNTEQIISVYGKYYYSEKYIDSVKKKMAILTKAFYETSQWMIMNNKQ